VEATAAQVFDIHNGMVRKLTCYNGRGRALADLGLET
jgi:hypothetical protein